MKAFEVPVKLSEGKLELPDELLGLAQNPSARLLLLVDEEDDWVRLSETQFAAGYTDADSIYDTLE
ncbi:hypothetical protein [Truepera radiovictrix]|uniref:Uncharacterized protein n=1 Tax=Truepera radiovictrix (strain DSM 17093 / CIP 108686 / LMG 22925 / RQ-24) TaxID=649638 RepID=D7CXA3_TRURR|nr:hypothetical protein [Truepera radiovictrix]ADI13227.1 conserved hypothetical protein [Truepera radiovictrix DSM 17093]WMT58209.1 hypothetical protein RCV51_04480 [Truepera radiovictrix]